VAAAAEGKAEGKPAKGRRKVAAAKAEKEVA
jgi:hypothetical protein